MGEWRPWLNSEGTGLALPKHRCHAEGCQREVHPRLLMCARCWRFVPPALKDAVWKAYRAGQEITKDPSPEYVKAAEAAITSVRRKERP
jgi:hypothetical protein